jgi:hypothetical protein
MKVFLPFGTAQFLFHDVWLLNLLDKDLKRRVVEELGIPVELFQHLTKAAADGLLKP